MAKIKKIAYWIFTALVAWEMALGAYWDLFRIQYVRDVFTHLHLPFYFLIIMGIWKLPCAVVLLMPRVPRLKEWAYAGLTFDLIGATYSIIAVGKPDWMFMVLPFALAISSYVFYQKRKKLIESGAAGRKTEVIGLALQ